MVAVEGEVGVKLVVLEVVWGDIAEMVMMIAMAMIAMAMIARAMIARVLIAVQSTAKL